jgi:hypothetical protein
MTTAMQWHWKHLWPGAATKLRLATLLLPLLGVASQQTGQVTDSEAGLHLACSSPLVDQTSRQLGVSCEVTNRSQRMVFLSTAPLCLEGPSSPSKYYLYSYIFGERYENVLQYNRIKVGSLDRAIQFKPTVHLPLSEIGEFHRLGAGASARFEVTWKLGKPPELPDSGDWRLRIKLVYLTEAAAARLQRPGVLPAACLASLKAGLQEVRLISRPKLDSSRAACGDGFHYDGCRDVISEGLSHLVSNSVTIHLSRNSVSK